VFGGTTFFCVAEMVCEMSSSLAKARSRVKGKRRELCPIKCAKSRWTVQSMSQQGDTGGLPKTTVNESNRC